MFIAAAIIAALLTVIAIGELGETLDGRGVTRQQAVTLEHGSMGFFLLATLTLVVNAAMAWFWAPKVWARTARSRLLRLATILITVPVAYALALAFMFIIGFDADGHLS